MLTYIHLFLACVMMGLSLANAHEGHDQESDQSEPVILAEPIDNRVAIPSAPVNGIQVVTPELFVPAQSERQFCWYYSLSNKEALNVIETVPFQGKGGHHMIGMITTETTAQIPDGTVEDCTKGESRMGRPFLALLFPNNAKGGFSAPAGYAAVLKPGARLVFQFHYHNHSSAPMLVRDVMNIVLAKPGSRLSPMAPWLTATADFKIPARAAKYTVQYECPASQDMNIYLASGHMHEHASNVVIEIGKAGRYEEVVRAENIKPYEAASAGIRFWPVDKPYKVAKGDMLRTTCTWNNTEDHDLSYPEEMCATFFFHLSGADPVACVGQAKVLTP
ncbi:MAG: hypothetical protein AABY64_06635 [Bdellovibrionota bacterium]